MYNNKIRVRANWLTRLLMILCLTLLSDQSVLAQKHGLGDIPLDPEVYQRYLKVTPDRAAESVEPLPSAYDARNEYLVTPVKDQGQCGSCWAFASVGAFESHLAKEFDIGEDVNLLDLSEQQQVSCNTVMSGCNGGSSSAICYWEYKGPFTEDCFGYTASHSTPCVEDPSLQFGYRVSGWHTVPQSTEGFKTSLYDYGPSYWRFDVYSDFYTFWGTYNPGAVYIYQSGSYQGGHAVLLIGWDDSKGAYLCKNSWGPDGPNGDGTFWIAYSGHSVPPPYSDLRFGMANFTLTGEGCGDGICSPEAGRCSDGIDNDCDGLFDCDDSDCVSDPTCVSACTVDDDCNDYVYCNGKETCVGGFCQAGTPVNCDDGVGCTDDSCDEATETCTHSPNDGSCDDDNPCTDDHCDPLQDCQNDPNDNNSCDNNEDDCTADFCDAGTCVSEPIVPCCGNGVCEGLVEAEEDCNTCQSDCIRGSGDLAVCGNGVCEPTAGEDCLSCADDCRGKQVGTVKRQFCCGDGDGYGTNPVGCDDPRCTKEGWACGDPPVLYCCGNGFCTGAEDSTNCAIDCGEPPVCGDGTCDPGEECNCSDDCGTPPASEAGFCTDGVDNDCDSLVDCDDGDCETDSACSSCIPKGGSCSNNDECCSGTCLPAGRCK